MCMLDLGSGVKTFAIWIKIRCGLPDLKMLSNQVMQRQIVSLWSGETLSYLMLKQISLTPLNIHSLAFV